MKRLVLFDVLGLEGLKGAVSMVYAHHSFKRDLPVNKRWTLLDAAKHVCLFVCRGHVIQIKTAPVTNCLCRLST